VWHAFTFNIVIAASTLGTVWAIHVNGILIGAVVVIDPYSNRPNAMLTSGGKILAGISLTHRMPVNSKHDGMSVAGDGFR
jgi:hypothetical protein